MERPTVMPCWTLFTSASRSVPVKEAGRGEGCDECPMQHCRRTVVCRLSSQARQQGYLIFLNLNTSQCKKKIPKKINTSKLKWSPSFYWGVFKDSRSVAGLLGSVLLSYLLCSTKPTTILPLPQEWQQKTKQKKNRTGSWKTSYNFLDFPHKNASSGWSFMTPASHLVPSLCPSVW